MKKMILALAATGAILSSCEKTEPLQPQDMLEGQWTIYNQEFLGQYIAGDGSYLTFSGGLAGTGTDFKASDTTSGTFTYTMNDEATQIIIVDTMSEGGNYAYTWDVLELTETKLRMTASTGAFGDLLIEMDKE